MNLNEFVEPFLTSREAQGCSPNTVRYYRGQLIDYFTWCELNGFTGSDLVGIMGAETFEGYSAAMLARGLSPFSVDNCYRSLRCYCRWIWRRYRLPDESPFLYLKRSTLPDLLPKAISYTQMLLLHHSIKPSDRNDWVSVRDKLIVRFLFCTGVRAGELISLKIGDVDVAQRRLKVRRWKTGIEGFIPLTKTLVAELGQWLETQRPAVDHDGLWPSYIHRAKAPGPPLAGQGLTQMLRRRCKAAGLPRFAPHSFRHGTAIEIIARGGALNLVTEMLGHRQVASSMRYLRFDISRTQQALDRIFD